jgi:hypothetical protein
MCWAIRNALFSNSALWTYYGGGADPFLLEFGRHELPGVLQAVARTDFAHQYVDVLLHGGSPALAAATPRRRGFVVVLPAPPPRGAARLQ